MASAFGSGIEWVSVISLEFERAEREAARERHHRDRRLAREARLLELPPENGGGERGGVDRAAQERPEILDGADVVLVGVGEHDAEQALAPFDDERGVGHHHLDPRQALVREGDAEIDDHPVVREAVKIEVHADLARPAERDEDELAQCSTRAHGGAGSGGIGCGHHFPLLRRWISQRPHSVSVGSTVSITGLAPSKRGAKPPVATTPIGSPHSARMRATRPSINPT